MLQRARVRVPIGGLPEVLSGGLLQKHIGPLAFRVRVRAQVRTDFCCECECEG